MTKKRIIIIAFVVILVYGFISCNKAGENDANIDFANVEKLFDEDRYDEAINELNEIIKLNSNSAEAYAFRAGCYIAKEDYNKAMSDANKAIKFDRMFAKGYYQRGRVYFFRHSRNKEKDYDRAIADFSEAIKLDPNYANAYYTRAYVYLYFKYDYDRAISDSSEGIKIDPEKADFYNIRGEACFYKKDYDRAISEYMEALRVDPDNLYAQYNIDLARSTQLMEIAIPIKTLLNDFYSNEISAKSKYAGNIIITGTISEISTISFSWARLELPWMSLDVSMGSGNTDRVSCIFRANMAEEVKNYSVGNNIFLEGTVEGYSNSNNFKYRKALEFGVNKIIR